MKKLSGVAICLLIFLVIGGLSIFQEYFSEHTYYYDMLEDGNNRLLLVRGIVSAAIPVTYKALSDKASAKGIVRSTVVAVLFFAYAFIAVRDEFIGSAFIALPINIGLMLGGASLMLGGMWSGGSMLYRRLYHQEADTLDRSIRALILGFLAVLMISWLLVMTTLLYQIVVVLCLAICGYLIYQEHSFWKKLASNMSELINKHLGFDTWNKGITTVLLMMTIMYLCYGLMLAYIPYPTAWDANHAYMYFPKVRAEHNGYLWNSLSAQFTPSPWITYTAVWFQFGYAFQSIGGWIWPDTWAVVMNYFSVLIVMIMSRGLIRRVIAYTNLKDTTGVYHIAWLILISWMTSGMGAFLVFVDNKSDFGVLAITLCALVLVFDWLPKLRDYVAHESTPYLPLVLSGLTAGIAVFSKPTSLFDFASIAILFAGVVTGIGAMVGTGLLVVGVMAVMKITTVPLYMSSNTGAIIALIGLIIIVTSIGLGSREKMKLWSRLILWGAVMIGFLVVIKTPLMMWRSYSLGYKIDGVKSYIQGVLMGYNGISQNSDKNNSQSGPKLLLAQASAVPLPTSCSMGAEGLTQATLYSGTIKETIQGAGEDFGRYIGYGGKTRDKPRWGFVVPDNTCFAFDADARELCKQRLALNQGNFSGLEGKLQGDALALFEKAQEQQKQGISINYIEKDLTRQLNLYRQDKTLLKSDGVITIPYRWIIPLNITYNRSLQNLSSYYTDIGVLWLILLVFLTTATIRLLVYDRTRAIIPMTTVIAWLIWWVSGSAILWYGIGLIIWTIIAMIVIVDTWTDDREVRPSSILLVYYVLGLLSVIAAIQLLLNFIRIGSQGGGGIFVQYKTANARTQEITDQLSIKPKITYGVSGKDIFDLQFPHYNKTIAAIDAQKGSKEAVLIAGTYMPYFIYNQYNIIQDGFLTLMWEWFSDQNVCRSYLRLKDKNLTYLVIDPNIATVVMGDGNLTLRDRMFAKIDPSTGKIVQHGTISMLSQLVSSGYIELFNTNNIAAKYAFTLSDAEIMSTFGVSPEDIILTRTKLATARFRGEEGNTMLQKVLQIMTQRFSTPQGIADLADIFGKNVDVSKIVTLAQQATNPAIVEQIKLLNQDERYLLANYLSLMSTAKNQPQQYQQQLLGLLQQSIGSGSQIIVFKVR